MSAVRSRHRPPSAPLPLKNDCLRRPARASIPACLNSPDAAILMPAKWNVYNQPPLKPENQETAMTRPRNPAWRFRPVSHACQPGLGAARNLQSRLVRPVLSECKLPELRTR